MKKSLKLRSGSKRFETELCAKFQAG